MFKCGDLVTVSSGSTVFRIIEIDEPLAVLVRHHGSCGEMTVNISHLKPVEVIKVKDMNRVFFEGTRFFAHDRNMFLLGSGQWVDGAIEWFIEPEDKRAIMCVVITHYAK